MEHKVSFRQVPGYRDFYIKKAILGLAHPDKAYNTNL